jgi:hypothetical protein
MRFRRVVLGIGTLVDEQTLRAAAELAQSMELALLGLFVEEADLFQLAALPFAAEVSVPSARTRRLDPATMALALRARSGEARRALARRLEGATVPWDFTTVRGSALSAMLEASTGSDLLVASTRFGSGVDRGRERERMLQGLRECHRSLLLVDQSPPRAPVAAVIAPDASIASVAPELGALALHYGGPLTIILAGSASPEADRLNDRGRAVLADLGIPTRLHRVAGMGAETLQRELAAEPPGLIVLCGSARSLDAAHAALEPLAGALLLLPAPA